MVSCGHYGNSNWRICDPTSFDFAGSSLIQFVKHCADHFLISDVKDIRLEAVRTCCTLLKQAIIVSNLSDLF
jgi:hypothetical protein